MEYQDLIYEKKERIAWITINRPQVMNAISPVTQQELIAAFNDFDADDDLWVAVLSGAGDRAFCAGNDMKWQDTHPEDAARIMAERKRKRQNRVYWHLDAIYAGDLPREIWKPIIGAIKGYCVGGGLEVAMNCDLLVAAETAVFGLPEVSRGWPPAAANFLMPRHVPLKIAAEMLLIGDRITAQRAFEIGLVNRVVPADQVLETAEAMARRICQNPPLAVQAAKELMMRGIDMPMNYAPIAWNLFNEAANRRVEDSEDRKEGRRAFAEKRKPNFKGR